MWFTVSYATWDPQVLDGMEDDPTEPWHACRAPAWCGGVDHISLSLINAQLPHLYSETADAPSDQPDVGLVLSDGVRIACAMVVDGGTVMAAHGGCDRCTCGTQGCGWCVYREHQLAAFVDAHLSETCKDGVPCRELYNEVVVLKEAYEASLPHSIRAFFCVHTPECTAARAVRERFVAAFVAAYPSLADTADSVPVLHYAGAKRGFVEPGRTQMRGHDP